LQGEQGEKRQEIGDKRCRETPLKLDMSSKTNTGCMSFHTHTHRQTDAHTPHKNES